jgi:manganese transport protein
MTRAARDWLRPAWWGPAFAVSIGYIDPGNWATDLMAGRWQCRLLWVVLASSALALALQAAVAQLTVSLGTDLATAVGERWPRARTAFWLVFFGASVATDFAEFTGIVLGLQLLFGLSVAASVPLAAALTLWLLRAGTARFERAMMAALGIISLAFLYQLHVLAVPWADLGVSLRSPALPDAAAWWVAVGIVGATVMPHNLFLHSALVHQGCRGVEASERDYRGRVYLRETVVALVLAGGVNAGILLVGSALGGSSDIETAHALLRSISGPLAGGIFGAALLLAGLTSSATATLSGDFVFNGLASWRCTTITRRLLTMGPAALALLCGISATRMMVGSQVALAVALPVAVVPMPWLMRQACAARHPGLWAQAVLAGACCVGFDCALLWSLR